MYTIGKVSKMFNLPISTLRYYDKEGFFPNIKRKGNIRYFGETELEAIRVIECLKKSDLEIKDIKQFFIWFSEGASTLKNRQKLFKNRKLVVENKIKQLEKVLSMLKFKCWYYDTLVENQEKGIDDPVVDLGTMPDEIKKYYDHAHEE
ncbi:MAG: MerR family transcriptional regulator [Helcococcus sp.]|nr:MerR family transcriptional regulator [Helcococcus sp.]